MYRPWRVATLSGLFHNRASDAHWERRYRNGRRPLQNFVPHVICKEVGVSHLCVSEFWLLSPSIKKKEKKCPEQRQFRNSITHVYRFHPPSVTKVMSSPCALPPPITMVEISVAEHGTLGELWPQASASASGQERRASKNLRSSRGRLKPCAVTLRTFDSKPTSGQYRTHKIITTSKLVFSLSLQIKEKRLFGTERPR